MITKKNITKSQATKLITLLERETRCEIIARFGRFDNLEFGEYAIKQIEYKNKIRKALFGTSNLVVLGTRWGLIRKQEKKRKRKTLKRRKKQ